MKLSEVRFDCHHFRGGIPCKPNKERNTVCSDCDEYKPVSKRILIIKLGAIGDVIRTTPLVVKYRKLYPDCHISWLTQSPDILPKSKIDEIYKYDFNALFILQNKHFDIAINLDKEYEACSLLNLIDAKEKYGFTLENYHIAAATPAAEHKLITGFYDNISQRNTKSYLEEIFEICHLKFDYEEYLLDVDFQFNQKWSIIKEKAGNKKIIGLNTGCGARWLTRLWPEKYWVELIEILNSSGYYPLILGGPEEHEQNLKYSKKTNAYYPGSFSLKEFIAIANQCDVIVSAVSMMMHIATALKKPLVLFVNIFNPHEFELYGRGEIIKPPSGCDCYYGNTCKRENHCMNDIEPQMVFDAIARSIKS